MAKLVIVLLLPVIVGVGLFFALQQGERIPLNHFLNITSERYWGEGERPSKIDESIRPFKIDVPDSVLDDLKLRLNNTRYFSPITGSPVDYGISPAFTKDLVDYWLKTYDWRKQEKLLNQYPQFITNIDGIDVHFIHVKAKNSNNDPKFNSKPLLLVHGWPGSFFEFQQIIPMLTDPASHGANGSVAYDVVAPSIPGYGFSSSAKKRGFDQAEAALVFAKLMKRLGYQKYIAQGGDWGALIVNIVAGLNPENCAGVHMNCALLRPAPLGLLRYIAGNILPAKNFYDEDELAVVSVFPVGKFLAYIARETGYMHLQGTRPYTLAEGLTDSPAGLATYIAEKFYAWSDCNGDVYNSFTKDQLLTDIMIYWVTNTISSSVTFYKEFFDSKYFLAVDQAQITIPAAYIAFPKEFLVFPRDWIEARFVNLLSYSKAVKGGHFAAMEEPTILAEDLWKFHQLVPF